ncbi:MAG: hypothetical protein MZU95_16775 [Desulfomicrobium escambiense]|nr:hypothetical protein [Desulfomicrobium escambiense]
MVNNGAVVEEGGHTIVFEMKRREAGQPQPMRRNGNDLCREVLESCPSYQVNLSNT